MRYLCIFVYFFLLLGCQSVKSESEGVKKELIFDCRSDQYEMKIYKKNDHYLIAYFIDDNEEKILEGAVKRVDIFGDSTELAQNPDSHFYYTYNARAQYEAYDLEFSFGNLSVNAYHFYDGQFDPNVNIGFWIHLGQEKHSYSCDGEFVDELYVLNNIQG